jgi:hypothetical protein
MIRRIAAAVAALLLGTTAAAAELSEIEQRWLRGAWPVVTWAKAERLPLDIVVQPQPAPEAAPLAMAFVEGRCKLVLSMRGNPQAQATLERIPKDLQDGALELMAAHEVGHCRRHLDGAWFGVPAGFSDAAPSALPARLHDAWTQMRAVRREEAYADLVGLAWTSRHHAADYTRLHGWLLAERTRERVPGDHHDTLAWIEGASAERLAGPDIFAAAAALWPQGLATEP